MNASNVVRYQRDIKLPSGHLVPRHLRRGCENRFFIFYFFKKKEEDEERKS